MASAVGSPGEALRGGGEGGSKEDWFFYPTASPTVAFRNGTDSLESLFAWVPSREAGRAVPGAF